MLAQDSRAVRKAFNEELQENRPLVWLIRTTINN